MKKVIIILLIIIGVICGGTAEANFSDWSNYSKSLSATFLNFEAIDLAQTKRWIEGTKKNPVIVNGYALRESNPLYPNNKKLYIPVALTYNIVSYYALDKFVNETQRKIILTLLTAAEIWTVYKNSQLIKDTYNKENYTTIPLVNISF